MEDNNCKHQETIGHGERLSRKQEQAIAALLAQPTLEAAARVLNVAPITLTRWLRRPHFRNAYMMARRETVSCAIATVQRASSEAVDTLRDVMNDVNSPAASRVTAARAILDTAIKGVEVDDLSERLEELEGMLWRAPR